MRFYFPLYFKGQFDFSFLFFFFGWPGHEHKLINCFRMLLGSALTLGNELDLFDDREEPSENTTNAEARLSFTDYLLLRRGRLRRLLFVYISQLASRIGCALPKTPFHDTIRSSMRRPDSILDRQWHDHMTSWIELSRLIRTSSEFLFLSKPVTQDLLRSGRYTEFLEHFQPLLSRWLEDYTKQSSKKPLRLCRAIPFAVGGGAYL